MVALGTLKSNRWILARHPMATAVRSTVHPVLFVTMSNNEQTLFADGFDDAIIGVYFDRMVGKYRVVYDSWKMIEALREREDMTTVEAVEYLEFNVWTAYVGDGTPLYIDAMNREQIIERIDEQ